LRISRKRPKSSKPQKRYNKNTYIRSEELRIIGENGENLGVMSTQKALDLTAEQGLDLVEVSPLANPPVAKIVSFSKLKYEEDKQKRKEKANRKITETKVIRLSVRIGEHDFQTRINQAQKFIKEGNKVKIELRLRGRERQHKDLARTNLQKFIDTVNQTVEVKMEQEIKIMGGQFSTVISGK